MATNQTVIVVAIVAGIITTLSTSAAIYFYVRYCRVVDELRKGELTTDLDPRFGSSNITGPTFGGFIAGSTSDLSEKSYARSDKALLAPGHGDRSHTGHVGQVDRSATATKLPVHPAYITSQPVELPARLPVAVVPTRPTRDDSQSAREPADSGPRSNTPPQQETSRARKKIWAGGILPLSSQKQTTKDMISSPMQSACSLMLSPTDTLRSRVSRRNGPPTPANDTTAFTTSTLQPLQSPPPPPVPPKNDVNRIDRSVGLSHPRERGESRSDRSITPPTSANKSLDARDNGHGRGDLGMQVATIAISAPIMQREVRLADSRPIHQHAAAQLLTPPPRQATRTPLPARSNQLPLREPESHPEEQRAPNHAGRNPIRPARAAGKTRRERDDDTMSIAIGFARSVSTDFSYGGGGGGGGVQHLDAVVARGKPNYPERGIGHKISHSRPAAAGRGRDAADPAKDEYVQRALRRWQDAQDSVRAANAAATPASVY